ncbi:MAG: hypothetical protein R6X02_16815 [Enhygromyxa sp.]
MSLLDPAPHVPSSAARPLEKLRIGWAIPVYPWWFRLNVSSHEALFQEAGYHENWNHIEFCIVKGLVPMYQKFTTKVLGDANAMALRGHDTGPLVPHLNDPPLPLNLLLGLNIISASCKWPVSARRRLHKDQSLCAFASILAPYLYCSANAKQDQDGDEPSPKPSGAGAMAKAKQHGAAAAKGLKGAGVGLVLLPMGGKTVFLSLSLMDIILGALDVAISKAVDKLWDKIWIVRTHDAKRHVKPFTNGAARKYGWPDGFRYARDTTLNKAYKNAAKGFALKAEVGLPFKLASCNLDTGESTLWTYSFGRWNEAPALEPLELRPEEPEPTAEAEPQEPQEQLGPYDPNRTMLEEFFMEAPHAG